MRPTIDDQLDGALRLLDTLATDDELSASSVECVVNVRRLVKNVARSWAALPAFYAQDNDDLIAVLGSASVFLPIAMAEQVCAAVSLGNPPVTDVRNSAVRNSELRSLLSAVIHALPVGGDGDACRAQIGGYLRRRAEIDPT